VDRGRPFASANACRQTGYQTGSLSLDALISPDAKLELVKNDFGFTEGIVWVDQGNSGYLLLSDMYANVIYKLTPEGKVSLYLDHSGYTGYDIWRVGMPQPDANRKDAFFMIG
jgi:sugar lactone lactonase YvrE